jgi:hypothetical protein
MKYFLDTEFIERPGSIQLISIGIVAQDGREYYAVSKDFNLNKAWRNEWIRNNVLQSIFPVDKFIGKRLLRKIRRRQIGVCKTNKQIASDIIHFVMPSSEECKIDSFIEYQKVYSNPEFYGYYADYDWVVFCWLFGRMIDLPAGFPMYCRDLKQMLDDNALTKDWKRDNCPDPEGEHNALIDAKWNKKLYDKIIYFKTH